MTSCLATVDMFGHELAPARAPAGAVDLNTPDDSPWPADVFAGLPTFGFDLIMADPPWHFGTYSAKGQGKGAAKQYRTWTLDKVRRLPVGQLAARDCVLFLWVTSPLLLSQDDPSFSPVGSVLKAWGFRYGALGGWAKRTVNDKRHMGTGYVVRQEMEPFFIATTGSVEHSRAARNLITGLARGHSAKPDAAYAWCEQYMPGARMVELCSRRTRKGWSVWGDETGKLDEVRA